MIPLAFAENEKELLLINHYTNLQPLWAFDNQLKSDNINSFFCYFYILFL